MTIAYNAVDLLDRATNTRNDLGLMRDHTLPRVGDHLELPIPLSPRYVVDQVVHYPVNAADSWANTTPPLVVLVRVG